MQVTVLLFGIIADLIGESTIKAQLVEQNTVGDFKKTLIEIYPQLKNHSSYAVAINETYAFEDAIINPDDIIAIIPPVSGG
ncbi:MoaD/ThiS family protein [Flavicella sp.]|uniref:MoaD/ThiS family protein n=1 Tax=Flavicella sp. TaxID=2957742 RepID=UPI00301A7116